MIKEYKTEPNFDFKLNKLVFENVITIDLKDVSAAKRYSFKERPNITLLYLYGNNMPHIVDELYEQFCTDWRVAKQELKGA